MARSSAGMNEAAEAAKNGASAPAASTPSDEFTVIGGTHTDEVPVKAPEVPKDAQRPVAGSVRVGEDKYREVYGQGGWLRQDEDANARIPGGGVLLHGFRKHPDTLTPEELETVKQQALAAGSAKVISWNEDESKPRGSGSSSRSGGRAPREVDPDANYKKNLKDRFAARSGQGAPEKSRKQVIIDANQHATLLNDHLNTALSHVDENHSLYGVKSEAHVLLGQVFNHLRIADKLNADRKQGQANSEIKEATRKLRQAHAKVSGDDFVAGTGTPAPNLGKDLMKNEAHADVELTSPTTKAPRGVRIAGNVISTSDPDYIEAVRRIKEGQNHPDPKVRMQFKNLNPQALAKMMKSTQGTKPGRQWESGTGDSPMTPGTPRLGAPAAQPASGGAPVSFREESVPRPGDKISTEGLGPAPKKRRLPVSWNREGNAVVNGKVFLHPQTKQPVNLGSFPSVQEAIKHIEGNSELPNKIAAPTSIVITPPGGRKPVKPNKNAVEKTSEKGPTATQKSRAAELAKEEADKKARLAEKRATRPAPAAEPAPPTEDEQIASKVMDKIKKDLAAGKIPKRKKMPGEGTVNG